MANKTSIRFFEDVPVRAVWDDESAKWWFCAMDIAEALTKTTNPRVYWATVKRRNPQLIAICKQLKFKAINYCISSAGEYPKQKRPHKQASKVCCVVSFLIL